VKKAMTIREFMNREDERFFEKAKRHIQRNKSFYITVAGTTVVFLFCGLDGSALASSGIDDRARIIYNRLVSIGKWIVIVKAAIDVIQTATNGDFAQVKTKILGYLIVFLTLLGLPWAFEELERLFSGM
jgi:hypothetical protein